MSVFTQTEHDEGTTNRVTEDKKEKAASSIDEINDSLRITLDTVALDGIEFLWEDFIPAGSLIYVHGQEGAGKSTAMMKLMIDITHGSLSGKYKGRPQRCAIVVREDGLGDVLKPRYVFSGGTREDLLEVWDQWYNPDTEKVSRLTAKTASELQELKRRIQKFNIKFLVLDSRMEGLPIKMGTDNDVYNAIGPLRDIAYETGCTIVIIGHDNKGLHTSSRNQSNGSQAYYGVARGSYHIMKTGFGEAVFALIKANGMREDVPAQTFKIHTVEYHIPGRNDESGEPITYKTGACEWSGETDIAGKTYIEELLTKRIAQANEARRNKSSGDKRPPVKNWIITQLLDAGNDGIPLKELLERGKEQPYEYASGSITNAGTKLEVVSTEAIEVEGRGRGRPPVKWLIKSEDREAAEKLIASNGLDAITSQAPDWRGDLGAD